jgi:hypothetical protein
MSRLTLRLPETLHRQLTDRAGREGVSLNQYIVFSLTRQVTLDYMVHPGPEPATQQATFSALLERLGRASFDEIQETLEEREEVSSESELTPEVVARLQRLNQAGS